MTSNPDSLKASRFYYQPFDASFSCSDVACLTEEFCEVNHVWLQTSDSNYQNASYMPAAWDESKVQPKTNMTKFPFTKLFMKQDQTVLPALHFRQ